MASLLRIACLLTPLTVLGCAYRFTNEHIVRPEGIRTIAVEAIYDTSREVIPHEIFWEELQAALAADGKLRLAPQASADAYLRAHITDAAVVPEGSIEKNEPVRDPKISGRTTPPDPSLFKPLGQAGEVKNRGQLRLDLTVEVWSLRTRSLLLRRSYRLAQVFHAFPGFGKDAVTPRPNYYLRYEEALQAKVRVMAKDVGTQVLQDLLVH